MSSGSLEIALVLVRRPTLWVTAAVEARRMVPRGWWRRAPFLPRPDPSLLAFRAETQYGDPHHRFEPRDVVVWLEWCRAENRRGG